MFDKKNLKLRGETYHCVKSVPINLQPYIKKEKLTRSLKTKDLKEANKRKTVVLAEFEMLFNHYRQETCSTDKPQHHDRDIFYKGHKYLNDIAAEVHISQYEGKEATRLAKEKFQLMIDQYTADSPDPLDQVWDNVEHAESIAKGELKTSQALSDYLEELKGSIKNQTLDEKRSHLNDFLKFLQQDFLVKELSHSTIKNFLNEKIMPLTINIKTKRKRFNNLKQFIEWLESRGFIEYFGIERLKVTGKESKCIPKRKMWEDKDIQLLFQENNKNADDKKHKLNSLMMIAMYSGMRLNEICELTKSDVNDNIFIIRDGKNKNAIRKVPIHRKLQPLIKTLLSRKEPYLIEGLTRTGPDNKRSKKALRLFSDFKIKLGFDSLKVFHSFRKSFITKMDRLGIKDSIMKQIVGHENSDITTGTYSEGYLIEQLMDAVNQVEYDLG